MKYICDCGKIHAREEECTACERGHACQHESMRYTAECLVECWYLSAECVACGMQLTVRRVDHLDQWSQDIRRQVYELMGGV